ncbi:hypothetical protein JCM3775_007147 [Rhodotorula graminis]
MVKGEPGHGSEAKPDTSKHELTIQFGANEESLTIKVKGTVRFQKVYKAVADHRGRPVDSVRLTFDGKRIDVNDTPQGLGMEEEETIDMHTEQTGGGRRLA